MVSQPSKHSSIEWTQQEVTRLTYAAIDGERHAFAALYDLRVSAVHASIAALTGTDTGLDSLVTSVFVRAWDELPSIPRATGFDAWLLNLVVDAAAAVPENDRGFAGQLAELGEVVRTLTATRRDVLLLRQIFRLSPAATALTLDRDVDDVRHLERSTFELLADRLGRNGASHGGGSWPLLAA